MLFVSLLTLRNTAQIIRADFKKVDSEFGCLKKIGFGQPKEKMGEHSGNKYGDTS